MKGIYCRLIITVICVTAISCSTDDRRNSEQPNIIYILADDLGYGDVGCYNPGTKLPTPNFDRLAREGMRFTDAHSASACTPTRYGLLTGQYAFRSRLPVNVLRPYDPPLIEESTLTVGEFLQKNGYVTACIGKWHLGWDWPRRDEESDPDFTQSIPGGPITRGFDEYFGTDVPNYPPYSFIHNDRLTEQPTAQFPGGNRELWLFTPGPMAPGWQFDQIMPALNDKVKEYLRRRAEDKKPFFLYYSLTIPHEPLAPSEEFLGKSGINRVGDLILETDAALGEVMVALRELKMDKNTLLIFASDNGHGPATGVPALLEAGHDPSWPYRGYKGSLLEGGHRVPFIVHWPGIVEPGSVCTRQISLNSLMATCADILNTELPPGTGEDSYSILPLLTDQDEPEVSFPDQIHAGVHGWAVRQGKWKLVEAKEISPKRQLTHPEALSGLYDLDNDPAELTNLIDQHPEIVEQLKKQLEKIRFSNQ